MLRTWRDAVSAPAPAASDAKVAAKIKVVPFRGGYKATHGAFDSGGMRAGGGAMAASKAGQARQRARGERDVRIWGQAVACESSLLSV